MEIFAYAFMQRALAAAFLVGLLCSTVAFFVVLRRLSFAGVGVSHSALGGVAIGVLTGVNPILAGALFATGIAWAIGWVSRRGQLFEDTAIGALFSASMALGVVLLGFVPTYTADLMSYLFGNILAVTATDLVLLAAVAAAVLGFIAFFFKELLTTAFDEEVAEADGLPVGFLYYGLLTAVALTVVVSVKVVGVVLSSALLVIPAAIGFELAKDYRRMLAIAVLAGVFGSVAGLALSFYLDVASGGAIVLVEALLLLLAYLASPRRDRRRRARPRAEAGGELTSR